MNERSKRISRLQESAASRASYIRAKLNVLIPSQIRALRLKSDNMTQKQLAVLADMAQPRISAMERPGEAKFNIDTLVRVASAFKVALKVEFVPFSEMLAWENDFSQDCFNVLRIDDDTRFLAPVFEVPSSQASTLPCVAPPLIGANSRGVVANPFQGLTKGIGEQTAQSLVAFPVFAQQGGIPAYGTSLSNLS